MQDRKYNTIVAQAFAREAIRFIRLGKPITARRYARDAAHFARQAVRS